MARIEEIRVPDIGEFHDVPVIEIAVSPGDSVRPEDPLITLESDKATMDVPAPNAGTVKEMKVSVGDTVSEGTIILTLEVSDDQSESAASASSSRDASRAPSSGDGAGERAGDGGREETREGRADNAGRAAHAEAPARARTDGDDADAQEVVEVRVPDLGDFADVPVIEIGVKPGDRVAKESPLITLESDKATMDVPSPHEGKVKEIKVEVGDTVSEGSVIALLEVTGESGNGAREAAPAEDREAPAREDSAKSAEESRAPPAARPSPTAALASDAQTQRGRAHATPSVRRFARELGVDVSKVIGTGRKGRVLRADVQRFVKESLSGKSEAPAAAGAGIPPVPAVDFSKFGEVEERPLSRIKRISGPHLHRAWLNVPHVTHHDEADVTELEHFRQSLKAEAERKGVRITVLSFIMKAVCAGLREFPSFNASLSADGASLVYKKYFHVGVAVDTPNGLVVPVIRDVDQKGIMDLGAELAEVSARAREGKLTPDQMQGGCMSISSLGGIGGTGFTPIVNVPEVAILGVTRARMTPVWDGKEFVPRLMMPLDLSYDHRVIDGAEGARFMSYLVGLLGDVRRLLL